MDTMKICKNLKNAIFEVFESMFFMFPEEVEEGDTGYPLPENCFCARVSLKGSKTAFILCGSKLLVESMAENILGKDGKLDEESLLDVLKEAVNVIGGAILSLSGAEKDISLGVPNGEKLEGKIEDIDVKSVCEAVFTVEDEWLRAAIVED